MTASSEQTGRDMYSFFASIHARSEQVELGPQVTIDGRAVVTVHVPRALLSEPFDCNFEDTVEQLSAWPRMFVEPDGSFVWVSAQNGGDWQVDGNLYDRDELLQFVDIKGSCPADEFDRLLNVLGWPSTPLMFQLTREAVFLDEAEFRRWASACEPKSIADDAPPAGS